jgi:hypothetical protein
LGKGKTKATGKTEIRTRRLHHTFFVSETSKRQQIREWPNHNGDRSEAKWNMPRIEGGFNAAAELKENLS